MKKLILWLIVLMVLIAFVWTIYNYYNIIFGANINLNNKQDTIIFIPTGSDFEKVCEILSTQAGLISVADFRFVSKHKGFVNSVKPGRYRIKNNISNNALINLLRSGSQEPVRLTFNNVRTKTDLANRIANQLEFSSDTLLALLNDESVAKSYGFTVDEFAVMFLPNTYYIYWNITPENFIERMHTEYKQFWTEEKINKAIKANLTPVEVSILASIVISETNKREEMSKIAGVYINRLSAGMKLEADPTVKFAIKDFELQRILFKHLEYDSPYNTYLHKGLPPGPIYIPDAISIHAVLNYEKHDYFYMCARDDFSGYHVFAKTHFEHSINARKLHNALNKAKIK